jgi:hypothetical protein
LVRAELLVPPTFGRFVKIPNLPKPKVPVRSFCGASLEGVPNFGPSPLSAKVRPIQLRFRHSVSLRSFARVRAQRDYIVIRQTWIWHLSFKACIPAINLNRYLCIGFNSAKRATTCSSPRIPVIWIVRDIHFFLC